MSAIVRPGYGQRLWIGQDGTFVTDPYVVIARFTDGTASPLGRYETLTLDNGFTPPNAIGWNPIRQQCWMGLIDGTVLKYPDVWLCGEPTVVRQPINTLPTFGEVLAGAVVGTNSSGSADRELFILVESHTTGLKIVAVNMDNGSQEVWVNLPSYITQVIDIVPFAQQTSGITHPRGVIITGVRDEGSEQRHFLASAYSTGLFMWKTWPGTVNVDEDTDTYIVISGAWSSQSGAIVTFGKETLMNTSYIDDETGKSYSTTSGIYQICFMVIPSFEGGGNDNDPTGRTGGVIYEGEVPVFIVEDNEFSFTQAPVGGIKRAWGNQNSASWLRGGTSAPSPVGSLSTELGLFTYSIGGVRRQLWGPDPDQNFGSSSLQQSYLGGAVPGPGAMDWTQM